MKTLKEVSDMVGMSRRVIQEYEKAGLAQTPTTRNKYGYLLYDQSHIERLWQIRFYRELGYEKKQIQEILDDPQYDRRSAIKSRILTFKKKKLELENLIAMAETVEETGISPNVIWSEIPLLQNIPYDRLISFITAAIQLLKEEFTFSKEFYNELSDSEIKDFLQHILDILDVMDQDLPPESPEAEHQAALLHQSLIPRLSSSIILLYWLNLFISPKSTVAAELDSLLGAGSADYLYLSIRRYCIRHKSKTDTELLRAISRITRLCRDGSTPYAPETQKEVRSIHGFCQKIRLLTPDSQMALLGCMGKFYRSAPFLAILSTSEEQDGSIFLSESIAYYVKTKLRTKEEELT